LYTPVCFIFLIINLQYGMCVVYLINSVGLCAFYSLHEFALFLERCKMQVLIKKELILENCYILGGFSKNSMFNPSEETSGTSSIYLEAGLTHD